MTESQAGVAAGSQPQDTISRFAQTRSRTLDLCAYLSPEDMQVQSMEDASPTKWHLAHTTWFFEAFILKPYASDYSEFERDFQYLFNSYYNGIGPQFERANRGLLTRPSIDRILAYRNHVDEAIQDSRSHFDGIALHEMHSLIELGIQHEQQHQELILTDIKHAFFQNPQLPRVLAGEKAWSLQADCPLHWVNFDAGIYSIGYAGNGFCFDNERPRHRIFLEPFRFASRLTTNEEYLSFVESGGYAHPEFWLSEGWRILQLGSRSAPLYWRKLDDQWFQFTLQGVKPLDPSAPVMHVNYYEADAFARWCAKRLPTEQEWEVAAACGTAHPNLKDPPLWAPAATVGGDLRQMLNSLWQWTSSSYSPYPGYLPLPGAAGEYNGKFMVNQYVLRGGSFATPSGHIRHTYRNFFYPGASWQFSGIRLADSGP
ncbi:MAG: ergothioneine biosynthesis protein EgtB [Methylococcaceae bacterium]|nr:ergothioneine biosynthesis protein EgtB [Methylococcaceae bacterium]